MCYVLIFIQQDTKGATGNLYMDYLWWCVGEILTSYYIIIIIIYNLYRGKAPVTRSDFQGGPLRVKIKYTKAKTYNIIN